MASATSPETEPSLGPSHARFLVLQPTATEQIPPGAVQDAVVKELQRRKLDVVPPAELSAAEKACGHETCARALLAAKNGTHAVIVRFVGPDANEQSDADVTIVGASDPAVNEAHVRDAFTLPRTFTARMADAAGELAAKVAARTAETSALAARSDTSLPVAASAPLWKTLVPGALVAAGGASMAVGIGWLASNGQEACGEAPCRRVYDTRTVGWTLVGAGAAVAAFGVGWGIYLLHDQPRERREAASGARPRPGRVDVAVGPDLRSLALRGTF